MFHSWEGRGAEDSELNIEYLGFLWLFFAGGLLMIRLLGDTLMVRRPLLEPNLNAAGLSFMGASMLFFLMANVVTGEPSAHDISPARQASDIQAAPASNLACRLAVPPFKNLRRATTNISSGALAAQR